MKKKLLMFLLSLLFIFFAYVLFMLYLLTSNTKSEENVNYCKQYIPLLEKQYTLTHKYPEDLTLLSGTPFAIEGEVDVCGYSKVEGGYIFYLSYGWGVAGYDSIKQKWWYD